MKRLTDRGPAEAFVRIGYGPRALDALLCAPERPLGAVVLLYGDAGIRHGPPPPDLAAALAAHDLATLEVDLLTRNERAEDIFTKHLRFDVGLQAQRLATALAWLRGLPWAAELPLGIFATGAAGATALLAAAAQPGELAAVALWGGRPDLAGRRLAEVAASTLLLVERHNDPLLELNRLALPLLAGEATLSTVGDAAALAPLLGDWLAGHLAAPPTSGPSARPGADARPTAGPRVACSRLDRTLA